MDLKEIVLDKLDEIGYIPKSDISFSVDYFNGLKLFIEVRNQGILIELSNPKKIEDFDKEEDKIFPLIEEYFDEYSDEFDGGICGTCNGSGEGSYDGSRCYSCRGSGAAVNIK
tara:strand:- start:97 stop:435 length:339 start_codon:yes stop_codon:yes gene_type:complete